MDALLLAQGMAEGARGGWLSALTRKPWRAEVAPPGVAADLYAPADSPHWGAAPARGCVVLVHGMSAAGRRDHRLAAFAETLARLGFAVAVPDLPGMKMFRPEEADVARIEETLRWMARGGPASFARCGLLAFSFGAGPALRAAARPSVRNKVAAFVGVGAFYDLKNVLKHLTTGGGGEQPAFPGAAPIRHGKWLFLLYNARLLGLEAHQEEIGRLVARKRKDEGADAADLRERLPGGARALIDLLENKDPKRFEALYARQGAAQRRRLEGWGMRDVVPKVRGRKFFLHGRDDPFVPASESLLLASRARETSEEAVFSLILEGFRHVGMAGGALSFRKMREGARFLGFISAVLGAMEG